MSLVAESLYEQQKTARCSAKKYQKGRNSGEKKTDAKTIAQENSQGAWSTSRQSQTVEPMIECVLNVPTLIQPEAKNLPLLLQKPFFGVTALYKPQQSNTFPLMPG